ncbi:MAG: U32 family peptidase [Paludibacteraceae bacterium]|nr:U32 family peptidase [Paludibacteraceae bacterium]
MTPNEHIEIMAPVGSYESLAAAIKAGTDSVYFGIEHLNMRARSAANFTTDDLHQIVSICREAGVKTYLTVNTVIYPEDIPTMQTIVNHAKSAGVDAIIASDIAVMQYAVQQNVEVHLSTQLNIANTEALKFYAQFADVVVLARELNLTQVAAIHRDIIEQDIRGRHGEQIRIEMFCHGALCMAVSGKCYLSLHNLNSSANRGACAQICRRAYVVHDKASDVELEVDNEYIMSPKDLKTIHFLGQMLDAGVRVLKIEGRARGPEYVSTVVRCYREAVEMWEESRKPEDGSRKQEEIKAKIAEWDRQLATVFNRGFWNGYYLGQRLGEWTDSYGSKATKHKVYAGKCTNYYKNIGVAEFLLEAIPELHEGDELLITGTTTGVYACLAHDMRTDQPVTVVKQGELFAIRTTEPLHRGDKLYLLQRVAV